MTTTPTITNIPAADGQTITVTTRIDADGLLRIDVYSENNNRFPICSGTTSTLNDRAELMARTQPKGESMAAINREVVAMDARPKTPSMYQEMIIKDLGIKAEMYDPRHVEAYMRLERGTLDGLSRQSWAIELEQATICIDMGGTIDAEALAKSYGL